MKKKRALAVQPGGDSADLNKDRLLTVETFYWQAVTETSISCHIAVEITATKIVQDVFSQQPILFQHM